MTPSSLPFHPSFLQNFFPLGRIRKFSFLPSSQAFSPPTPAEVDICALIRKRLQGKSFSSHETCASALYHYMCAFVDRAFVTHACKGNARMGEETLHYATAEEECLPLPSPPRAVLERVAALLPWFCAGLLLFVVARPNRDQRRKGRRPRGLTFWHRHPFASLPSCASSQPSKASHPSRRLRRRRKEEEERGCRLALLTN